MSRAEKIAEAQRLRDQGRFLKDIAAELGVALSTVHQWLTDPDGQHARARKDSYRGTCERCGAPTDGSNGPDNAPLVCATCLAWTDDDIVTALRTFADVHHRSPTQKDALGSEALPNATTVRKHFGSWNAGLAAASLSLNKDNTPETQAAIEQLVAAGEPAAAVAKRFGVTTNEIYQRFRRQGTTITEFRHGIAA